MPSFGAIFFSESGFTKTLHRTRGGFGKDHKTPPAASCTPGRYNPVETRTKKTRAQQCQRFPLALTACDVLVSCRRGGPLSVREACPDAACSPF